MTKAGTSLPGNNLNSSLKISAKVLVPSGNQLENSLRNTMGGMSKACRLFISSKDNDQKMSNQNTYNRRRFLGDTLKTLGAFELSAFGIVNLNFVNEKFFNVMANEKNVNVPFGTIKQIDAGVLNIGYIDAGPANGSPVILLHGWPYDIYSFAEVTPILAAKRYRVIVPYLRGYGSTRFLSDETFRNGQ